MSTQIDSFFSYRVKPGMEERYESYLNKVLSFTETQEPYVLSYEIFRGRGSNSTCSPSCWGGNNRLSLDVLVEHVRLCSCPGVRALNL